MANLNIRNTGPVRLESVNRDETAQTSQSVQYFRTLIKVLPAIVPDHRATSQELTNRFGLKLRKGERQAVKLSSSLTNLSGLVRVQDRMFGVDGQLPAGAQGHFVRFNDLDDLSDYTIVPIPSPSAPPDNDGANNIAYCAGVNKLFTITASGRFLQLDPDTLEVTQITQSVPLNGNANDASHDIQADDTYVYLINYASTSSTRIVRYRAALLTEAPVVCDIPNGGRANGSAIGRGKLYLQGAWSHSYDSTKAHSWVARVDLATMTLEEFARLPNQWDSAKALTVAGDYVYVGCSNPKGPQLYRIAADTLSDQTVVHTGIPESFGGCMFDGRAVWAWYSGATVGTQRIVRIDPVTSEVTRYRIADAGNTETSVPPQPFTTHVISDGERFFVQMNNTSSMTGANVPEDNATLGPYLQRVTLLLPVANHDAPSGFPTLTRGLKSFGYGRVLTPETHGIHSVGGGLRLQGVPTPTAPAQDPVAPETGGQPADTTWTYYIVAVDAFGRRSLPSPAGSVVGAATLGGNAFNRISWTHVDGAVSYDVLRGDTATKIGSTPVPSFLDDGSAVPSAYSAPYRNETADAWVGGLVTIGDYDPASSYDGLRIDCSDDSVPPTITLKAHVSTTPSYLWQENDFGAFSTHYLYGSGAPGVSAGVVARPHLAEWVTYGGPILLNTFLSSPVHIATANAVRLTVAGTGEVGIGTSNPTSGKKLHVLGNVLVQSGDLEIAQGNSCVLASSNGTRYRLVVADDGSLSTTAA